MESWRQKDRPECLERRFEFQSYEKTRDFLDRVGDFCEKNNRFPDMSFGKTYVNITIRPIETDDKNQITKVDYEFAKEIEVLIEKEDC